jgi:hypothetical protein
MAVRSRSAPKAGAKLDKIEQKITKATARLREIESEARAAQEEVARLDQELEEHYSQPDADPEPTAILGERAVALERAEQPWAAKLNGQRRIIEGLEAERDEFIRSNLGALVAEQTPEAEECRDTLIESLRALLAAIDEFEAETTRAVRLAVAGGAGGDDVPRLHGGEQLRQAVRQMLARAIPLPLPGAFTEEPEDPDAKRVEAAVSDLEPSEIGGE